jgi:hypothetical protein
MKKKDAEFLLPLVNSKEMMDRLIHYMELRVSHLKESLVAASDIEGVKRLQGAIEEVRRLKSLRDEVLNPKD